MKNLHILPTDKPSRLIIYSTLLNEFRLLDEPIKDWDHKRNVYITNSEEIKEGEWYENNGVIFKADDVFDEGNNPNNSNPKTANRNKKIILTTDTDLIKDHVQAIDDEFLNWFVNNSSCEEVKVEGHIYKGQDETEYKISIPNLEIWKDLEIAIKLEEIEREEPKQETTLEEVAQNESEYLADWEDKSIYKKGFIEGANWQQERMYSEEDMKKVFQEGQDNMNYSEIYGWSSKLTEQEWFERFKKK